MLLLGKILHLGVDISGVLLGESRLLESRRLLHANDQPAVPGTKIHGDLTEYPLTAMNEEATIAICVSIAFVGFLVLCFRSYVRYHSQHRPRPTIPALYCINDIFVFIGFLSMISYTVIYAKIIIDRFNSGGQSPTPAHVVVAVANGSRVSVPHFTSAA